MGSTGGCGWKGWLLLYLLLVFVDEGRGSPTVSQALLSAKADVGTREGRRRTSMARPDWSMYHKTDELLASIRAMVADCAYARMEEGKVPGEESVAGRQVDIVVLGFSAESRIRDIVVGALQKRLNVVAVFGEHGREFISSEVALRIVQMVCLDKSEEADAAREELRRTELFLVPALGASSRQIAEMGHLCERLNANGVDLSRNWGFLWGKMDATTDVGEERPGTGPFSEIESRVVKSLVERVKPTAFVSVHSGDSAILLPWDHRPEPAEGEAYKRLKIGASLVVESHCPKCRVGGVSKLFGYNAFGTASDWAFGSAKVPFVYTWEIFGNPDSHINDCFRMFNPTDFETYERVVNNWSTALFSFATALHQITDNLADIPEPGIESPETEAEASLSTPSRRDGFASEWRRRGQGGTDSSVDEKTVLTFVAELGAVVVAVTVFITAALYVRTRITTQPARAAPFKIA